MATTNAVTDDTKTEIIYSEDKDKEGMNEDKKEENNEQKSNITLQFDSTVKISNGTTTSSENIDEVITPTVSVVMNTEVTTPTRTNAMMESTKSPPMRQSNTVTAFSITSNAVIPSL